MKNSETQRSSVVTPEIPEPNDNTVITPIPAPNPSTGSDTGPLKAAVDEVVARHYADASRNIPKLVAALYKGNLGALVGSRCHGIQDWSPR